MQPADKAADLAVDMRSTGLNHIAFDVGPAIDAEELDGLRGFLSELNRQVIPGRYERCIRALDCAWFGAVARLLYLEAVEEAVRVRIFSGYFRIPFFIFLDSATHLCLSRPVLSLPLLDTTSPTLSAAGKTPLFVNLCTSERGCFRDERAIGRQSVRTGQTFRAWKCFDSMPRTLPDGRRTNARLACLHSFVGL